MILRVLIVTVLVHTSVQKHVADQGRATRDEIKHDTSSVSDTRDLNMRTNEMSQSEPWIMRVTNNVQTNHENDKASLKYILRQYKIDVDKEAHGSYNTDVNKDSVRKGISDITESTVQQTNVMLPIRKSEMEADTNNIHSLNEGNEGELVAKESDYGQNQPVSGGKDDQFKSVHIHTLGAVAKQSEYRQNQSVDGKKGQNESVHEYSLNAISPEDSLAGGDTLDWRRFPFNSWKDAYWNAKDDWIHVDYSGNCSDTLAQCFNVKADFKFLVKYSETTSAYETPSSWLHYLVTSVDFNGPLTTVKSFTDNNDTVSLQIHLQPNKTGNYSDEWVLKVVLQRSEDSYLWRKLTLHYNTGVLPKTTGNIEGLVSSGYLDNLFRTEMNSSFYCGPPTSVYLGDASHGNAHTVLAVIANLRYRAFSNVTDPNFPDDTIVYCSSWVMWEYIGIAGFILILCVVTMVTICCRICMDRRRKCMVEDLSVNSFHRKLMP